MKKVAIKFLALLFTVTVSFTGVVLADENANNIAQENSALRSQVDSLSSKVDALSRQVSVLGSSAPSSGTTYVPSPSEGGGALQGITIKGFVDTQYNNNFSKHTTNPSVTAGSPGNPLRSFDNNQNTFTVNNFEVDIEKLANPEGGAGFRVDLSAGEDIRQIEAGTNAGAANSKVGLQQAYVQAVAPLNFFQGSDVFADTIDFKVGRFVTLAGTEVIESGDNFNISRGFLFGLAIPFTHTGVRATYNLFNDQVITYFGVNNGWDANVDNNTWKTWEGGWTVNPTDKLSFSQDAYYGPEIASTAGHKRFVMSNVVSYQVSEKLAMKGELTFGSQRRVVTNNTSLGVDDLGVTYDNAQWFGVGLHSRYALTEKSGVAYRFELFRDKNRFRTTGVATTLTSHTFTADHKFYDSLLGRVEFRYDHGQGYEPFNAMHHQSTLGAQLIYSFA